MSPVEIIIYSRQSCHLCDVAKEVIDRVERDHRLDLDVRVIDIDLDPELRARYDEEVPVVFIAGRKAFKYRVDPNQFVDRVRRANDERSR